MSRDINSAWDELRKKVDNCRKCPLHWARNHTVFGEGPKENCRCVVIGEGPGETEDEKGQPFIGESGQLLTKIFSDCGIPRETVYITNMVKCRPPKNRDPEKEEMKACNEYLEAQLLLLHPDIVVTVGKVATQQLFDTDKSISSMRGQWLNWRGINFFPIFHPSYLLRSGGGSNPVKLTYRDIQALKAALDRLQ